GPLLDRMDVIQLSGYTEEEKLGIAKRYLVPKQLEAHGLKRSQVRFGVHVLRLVDREYTREAGVRSLERQIAALCRKAATQVAKGKAKRIRLDEARVREWLGPRRFPADVRKRTADPGVATGLAVTAVGGDVLLIEAAGYPGKGRLTVAVLPSGNEPDLEELPAETRDAVEFVLADSLDRVLATAFDGARKRRPRRAPAAERQAATPAGTS